jgi:peptide deformylase
MLLEIIKAPDPILNIACDPVDLPDPDVVAFADDMINTMRAHNGRGLAAPQVGASIRMFCMKHGGGVRVLINPKVTRTGRDITEGDEGCLSIPGRKFRIKRHKIITIEWWNVHGMKFSDKLRGMDARCAQHEIDHLNGILISDEGVSI